MRMKLIIKMRKLTNLKKKMMKILIKIKKIKKNQQIKKIMK